MAERPKYRRLNRVRYTEATRGTFHGKSDADGTVMAEPIKHPSGWYTYAVHFDDGVDDVYALEAHLELVPQRPKLDMAGNANAAETPLVLRQSATVQPEVRGDALPTGTGREPDPVPAHWDARDQTIRFGPPMEPTGPVEAYQEETGRDIRPAVFQDIQAVVGAINGLRGELAAIRRLFEEARTTGPGAGHNNPPADDVLILTEQMIIAADDLATGLQREVEEGTPKSDSARRDSRGLDIFGTFVKGVLQEAGKGTGKVLTDQALKAGGEHLLRGLMNRAVGWITKIQELISSWWD